VRKVFYWLAPAIAMIPALLNLAVIPLARTSANRRWSSPISTSAFSTPSHRVARVYGIVLAGYAANSKYPFLGGIRSSAQMISYEIAMG